MRRGRHAKAVRRTVFSRRRGIKDGEARKEGMPGRTEVWQGGVAGGRFAAVCAEPPGAVGVGCCDCIRTLFKGCTTSFGCRIPYIK